MIDGVVPPLPLPLAAIALAGLVLGLLPLVWVLRRIVRALLRRPQPAAKASRYVLALVTAALLLGVGVGALGLAAALQSYRAFTKKTHVAEIQCIELAPQSLRLYLVPIAADGVRGATETYDLAGDEWTVGGDVLRLKPFLTVLGLETFYQVGRVEGRWLAAADANRHAATAFDRNGGTTWTWLQLLRNGTRGPLGWFVAGVHGQAVSQLPDRRAVYDLYVTPNGFVIDKRSL